MFIIRIAIAITLLLLLAIVGFAQSGTSTINIPYGSSVKLQANGAAATAYQWLKDGNIIPSANAKIYEANMAGVYTVISYNGEGCGSDPSAPVEIVIGNPGQAISADLAILKTSENRALSTNDIFEYQLTVKNNGPNPANEIAIKDILPTNLIYEAIITPVNGTANYDPQTRSINWLIPKMNVNTEMSLKLKVKTTKYGIYKNTATVKAFETDPDLSNNSSTDIRSVYGIIIPNVFTPNGDGKNDAFEIIGLSMYQQNEISIVNRWGSPVYEKKNYQNDWTANGLSDGTYFYVLKIKDENNEWQSFAGYVTVIR